MKSCFFPLFAGWFGPKLKDTLSKNFLKWLWRKLNENILQKPRLLKKWPEKSLWNNALTHRQEMPGDCWCGKAGEDIVSAGEVCEVRGGHGLTPTLTPHQHLTALCFRHWCVTGMTCSNLHHSAGDKWVTQMLLLHDQTC